MSALETFTPSFPVIQAHPGYWRVKRGIDIIVSASLLLLLTPLLLMNACAVKVTSPGPASEIPAAPLRTSPLPSIPNSKTSTRF